MKTATRYTVLREIDGLDVRVGDQIIAHPDGLVESRRRLSPNVSDGILPFLAQGGKLRLEQDAPPKPAAGRVRR
jgi:hypothetical protein